MTNYLVDMLTLDIAISFNNISREKCFGTCQIRKIYFTFHPLLTYDNNSPRNDTVYLHTLPFSVKSVSREAYYHTSLNDQWGVCLG